MEKGLPPFPASQRAKSFYELFYSKLELEVKEKI